MQIKQIIDQTVLLSYWSVRMINMARIGMWMGSEGLERLRLILILAKENEGMKVVGAEATAALEEYIEASGSWLRVTNMGWCEDK